MLTCMETIDVVIGRRVSALREERGWKQSDLRDMASRFGVEWSQSTVSEIESGKKRSDRLEVLAVLCSMFGITLDDLLAGDQEVMMSQPWTLASLREGLRGELEPASEKPDTRRFGGDNPIEVQRMAGKLGVNEDDLRALVMAVYGKGRRPIEVRDELAGVEQNDTSRSAQAKRGHASRKILRELQTVSDDEDVLHRGRALVAEWNREVLDYLDNL